MSDLESWFFVGIALLILLWMFWPRKCKWCGSRKGHYINKEGWLRILCKNCHNDI